MEARGEGLREALPDFRGAPLRRVRRHWAGAGRLDEELAVSWREDEAAPGTILAQSPGPGEPWPGAGERLELTVAGPAAARQLPRAVQQAWDAGGLRWLNLVDAENAELREALREAAGDLDVARCDPVALHAVADELGWGWLREWPTEAARRVLTARWELLAWRGTRRGLNRLAAALLGPQAGPRLEPEEKGVARLGEARLGDTRLAVTQLGLRWRCALAGGVDAAARARLERALAQEAPANVTIRVG